MCRADWTRSRVSAVCVLASVTTLVVSLSPVRTAAATRPPVDYRRPVASNVVLRAFETPVNRYAAGHRGVDLFAPEGTVVRAPADGVVRFSGVVAGRGVIVLAHPDGLSTEYEPVVSTVVRGQIVGAGQRMARLSGRHPGCASSCLHWGARSGEDYLDPMTLLRPLGTVRLLPWDGPEPN